MWLFHCPLLLGFVVHCVVVCCRGRFLTLCRAFWLWFLPILHLLLLMGVLNSLLSVTMVGVILFLQTLVLPLFRSLLAPTIAHLNILKLNFLEIPIRLIFIRLFLNPLVPQVLSFHPLLIINWIKRIVFSEWLLSWRRRRLGSGLLVVFTLTTADYVHNWGDFQPGKCVQLVGYGYLELFLYFTLKLLNRLAVVHLILIFFSHFIIIVIVSAFWTFFHMFSPSARVLTELLTGQLLQFRVKWLLHSAVQEWHALWYQWIVLLEK